MKRRKQPAKFSARTMPKGVVTTIHPEEVNAIVILKLEGEQLITASISARSLKDLGL